MSSAIQLSSPVRLANASRHVTFNSVIATMGVDGTSNTIRLRQGHQSDSDDPFLSSGDSHAQTSEFAPNIPQVCAILFYLIR